MFDITLVVQQYIKLIPMDNYMHRNELWFHLILFNFHHLFDSLKSTHLNFVKICA